MQNLTDDELATALTDTQRADILEAEIDRYLPFGFQVTTQTLASAQLTKPRRFSGESVAASFFLMGLGLLWLPFFGLGLLCLLVCGCGYALARDQLVRLRVAEDGVIHIRGDALPDPVSYSGVKSTKTRLKSRQ
jgi:hypothetical protein